jgi:hypothetical protein
MIVPVASKLIPLSWNVMATVSGWKFAVTDPEPETVIVAVWPPLRERLPEDDQEKNRYATGGLAVMVYDPACRLADCPLVYVPIPETEMLPPELGFV